MTLEKILIWLGSGLFITLIGRTLLLWGDSRWITRAEHTKVIQELDRSVTRLSEAIVAHSEQIKGLQASQQTANNLLQSMLSHVAALNQRDLKWYEAGMKRHTQDGDA